MGRVLLLLFLCYDDLLVVSTRISPIAVVGIENAAQKSWCMDDADGRRRVLEKFPDDQHDPQPIVDLRWLEMDMMCIRDIG